VQQAIDRLCGGAPDPGIGITAVLFGLDSQPVVNDTVVPVSQLARGFRIVCDAQLSPESFGNAQPPGAHPFPAPKPTCTLTLDLPYPIGAEAQMWTVSAPIGFQPIVLAASVKADENTIVWAPAPATLDWLKNRLFQVLGEQKAGDRVLARISAKGNFIWRAEPGKVPIYV